MIRAGSGLSTLGNSLRAAIEATRRAMARLEGGAADFCVVFVTHEHRSQLDDLLRVITETSGTPYVVGCSAAGVLAEGREVEHGPSVGVLAVRSDRLRATPFLFEDNGDHGLTAGVQLGQRLASSKDSDDLVLVWPDPHHIQAGRLLQGIDAALGAVPVAGAASSSRPVQESTFQFSGAGTSHCGVAGLRLGGQFRYHVAVTQGCRPLSEGLTVTRAHDNLILEVEGRPALDVLRGLAPPELFEDLAQAFQFLFVGLLLPGRDSAEHGEYLVRNVIAVDPDTGVLVIGDTVQEGQRIAFVQREGRAAREDLARVLRQIRGAAGDTTFRFGFYFNCLARGQALYRQQEVDAGMIRHALPGVPLLGLFGNAELAPLHGANHVFTYTGVLVLVAD